jgi:signal peptidase II
LIGLALIIVLVDQASKWLALVHLEASEVFSIIPGFFQIVLVKNRGMAFGILNQAKSHLFPVFLLAATIVAIGAILFLFWKRKQLMWFMVGLSLILGGAVGNLIDRIRLGYVIDFLDFFVSGYHWPAFNVADSAVTAGTLWILFNVIRGKGI